MSLVSLKTELRQELKLTPQLLQSMEVLQMNVQDLAEYLSRASEENPLLEAESPASLQNAYAQLRRAASWLDAGPQGGTFLHEDGTVPEQGAADRETESLAAFLRDQLERRHLEKPLLALCTYLAELVDEGGYLAPEDLESLEELKLPPDLTDRALAELQSLDPPGVGARDLSECLLLQLAQGKHFTEENIHLLRAGLPLLAEEDWDGLARLLGVSREQAKRDAEVIRSLNPIPSRGFASAERSVYMVPEATVFCRDGEVIIEMERGSQPKVELNQYYCSLLQSTEDAPETKDYLRRMMAEANELMSGLQSREKTLRQILGTIVKGQRDFFLKGGALAPLTMQQVAEELGLSTSTVSRAVKDKYLSFQGRSLALRSFFVAALPTGEGVSPQTVQEHIRRFIAAEDPASPLSDEALREALGNLGINASRRTVAKYRGEMGIPSSAQRKRG